MGPDAHAGFDPTDHGLWYYSEDVLQPAHSGPFMIAAPDPILSPAQC